MVWVVCPQCIFRLRRFVGVVQDPPSFEPGSWRGAGDLLIDPVNREYWLTSRPRVAGPRGTGVEVWYSSNGEQYTLVSFLPKEEVAKMAGTNVLSIENNQLIQDPLTGKYHLYMSLDVGGRWETFLVTSDDPRGPWSPVGFVIRTDRDYDSAEARDCTINVIDGRYIALCKAVRQGDHPHAYTELLTSKDGVNWVKLGLPTIDGKPQRPMPDAFLLNGDIVPSAYGPMFIGTVTTFAHNAHITKYFGAYVIDLKGVNLEEVFMAEWKPGSMYEHPEYPIHTYCNVVKDPFTNEWRILIEAIDPRYTKEIGVNTEVDRVLQYKAKVTE
ncbi:MAG: hypothetical protein RXQ74_00200 [Caldivirga sp.]